MFNRRSEILLVTSIFVAGAAGLVSMSALESFHPGLGSWWSLVAGVGAVRSVGSYSPRFYSCSGCR